MLLKQVVESVTLPREQPARGPIRPPCPVVDLVLLAGLAPRDFDDGLRQSWHRRRLPGTSARRDLLPVLSGSSRQPRTGSPYATGCKSSVISPEASRPKRPI